MKTFPIEGEFYRGLGCQKCLDTGYLGRTAISELLVVDDEVKGLIQERCGSHVIKEAAIAKGMSSLRADGLRKALAGQTTLEEVFRVTQNSLETDLETTERANG
jgi:general secretion pathway protein E